MKRLLFLTLLFLLASCASQAPVAEQHPSGLHIQEIEPNKWTALTKQNLLHLAQVYDLSPFLFTKSVQIQSRVIPHSHPVLTINTRNAEKPKKILATFLHEQLHWWLETKAQATARAILELKKIYPTAPKGQGLFPDSTYTHLIVCWLELKALSFYIGEKEAKETVNETMKKDKIYPWVYYQILNKDFAIKQVIRKNKLLPAPLT